MKQLTTEQIEKIRVDIHTRGIDKIDLEHEIMDHLITATEEKMNKGQSFMDAYKHVMISFGPHGMEKLQRQHERALKWQAFRRFTQLYKEYFTLPKISLTALLTVSIYLLLSWRNEVKMMHPLVELFLLIIWVTPILLGLINFRKYQRNWGALFSNIRKSEKKCYTQITALSWIIQFYYLVPYVLWLQFALFDGNPFGATRYSIHYDNGALVEQFSYSVTATWVISILLTIYGIGLFAIAKVVKQTKNEVEEKYGKPKLAC